MIANIVLAFFRTINRFFLRLFRGSGKTATTASKAGSGYAAKAAGHQTPTAEDELPEPEPGGIETLLFKQLSRPRLSERSASDLSLEEARRHLEQAETFYTYPFPLFARSDFFYEEVEEEFLHETLGLGKNSIDERFLRIMTLFRSTLNDNTRRLMLYYAPMILLATLLFGVFFTRITYRPITKLIDNLEISLLPAEQLGPIITFLMASIIGSFISFLVFSWPFKVAQQRNLLNLDNYLTSKFARINNNFQVAKRRALNVERNKRMSQIDELKEEAGVWTLSYQWFGMRLMLCELLIRNRLYQVRRNTILYWLFGMMFCLAITATVAITIHLTLNPPAIVIPGLLLASTAYIFLTFSVLQRTSRMLFSVLEANEWSRFNLMNLHKTIQDHVGEDKVQIVTFRDRNRIE